jgi:hypothetical protein
MAEATRLSRDALVAHVLELLLEFAQQNVQQYAATARACRSIESFGFPHSVEYRLNQLVVFQSKTRRAATTTTTTSSIEQQDNDNDQQSRRRQRILQPAYPFLTRIQIHLMRNDFESACDLAKQLEQYHCQQQQQQE